MTEYRIWRPSEGNGSVTVHIRRIEFDEENRFVNLESFQGQSFPYQNLPSAITAIVREVLPDAGQVATRVRDQLLQEMEWIFHDLSHISSVSFGEIALRERWQREVIFCDH